MVPLQISSKKISSTHYGCRYKWGGIVGRTAIYHPFYQTSMLSYRSSESLFFDPYLATGSGSRHLHSHISQVTIHPRPWGDIFLTSHPGTHAHVQNYRIIVIYFLSSDIVHIRYSFFMCASTWSSYISTTPSSIWSTLACNHFLWISIASPVTPFNIFL